MNNVKHLVRLLRPGQEMENPEKGSKERKAYNVLGVIAITCIMIPCATVVGVIAYFMTLAMMEAGGSNEGMLFIVQFISACAMIFGFLVVINEFYFSSDIDFLLPLPVKSYELILAKFWVTFLAESVIEFLVIFSAFIGYIAAVAQTDLAVLPIGIVSGLLGTVSLPIVPLVYCGIISLLIMFFFQGVRDRKALNVLMLIFSLLLLVLVLVSFHGLKGFSVDTYVTSLTSGDNLFLKVMNIMFLPGYFLISAATTKNWLFILLYIVISLVYLVIFLVIANFTYLPGLYAYKSIANQKEHKEGKKKKSKERSVFGAYLQKELRIILRTPSLLSNCGMINLFWPIIILVFYWMQRNNGTIENITRLHQNGNVVMDIILLTAFLAFGALTPAANGLASSSFTREGSHIDFMKYIPVPYETQVHIKGLVSLIFSVPSFLLDVVILKFMFNLSVGYCIYYFFTGCLMIFFMMCMGLILDSTHPKLIWEDELNALRGNLNVFFNMAIAILSAGVIIGYGFLLYLIPHSTIGFIYTIFAITLVFLDIFMYRYAIKKVAKNMEALSA